MFGSSLDTPLRPPPYVVAHRGASAHCPENTRAAFDAALRMQADAIEVDLQLTADQQIVLCHNPTLSRSGHSELTIADASFAQLRNVDVGSWFAPEWSGERLMGLPDFLTDYASRVSLMLEAKFPESIAADVFADCLLETLQPFRTYQPFYVLSFDLEFLAHLRGHRDWLRPIWNTKQTLPIDRVCREHGDWLFGIDCRIAEVTQKAVDTIHTHHLKAFSFTINSPKQMQKAYTLGIDGLIGDCPATLRKFLAAAPCQPV